MTDHSGPFRMSAALAALWSTSQPKLLERLAVIDRAVAARRDDALAPAEAEAARSEAHRLVGLLGTFGRPEGTGPASRLEAALAAPDTADPDELAALCAALRAVLETPP